MRTRKEIEKQVEERGEEMRHYQDASYQRAYNAGREDGARESYDKIIIELLLDIRSLINSGMTVYDDDEDDVETK